MNPSDLSDIDCIASAFGVDLVYCDHHSFSCNVSQVIFLNRHLDLITQRDVFFHELCHVLRHAGDQRRMTKLFEERQEMESGWFQNYAAIPFYMVETINLPETQREAVGVIAQEFKVSHKFAKERLHQIQRRIFDSMLWEENCKTLMPTKINENKWTPETLRILRQLQQQFGG
ncbi:ImmA/IrrE family metallo-endopeptidase [Paenibacillus alvei]|nr:ImmA/IrrE family metallo-endopeptidase [Paenibacillus alvei]NEZ45368.1 ImmA/IrrE family metallo-endopeptidase [Paenibacillus alvei]